MYIFLFLVLLLIVLYCLKPINTEESFSNKNTQNISNTSNGPYGDEVYQCNKKNKFQKVNFTSKYDSNNCIPCKNPPICDTQSMKCMTDSTFYYTMDNCVQDGTCRLPEDPINLFPTCKNK
jgi:hypothetical protein